MGELGSRRKGGGKKIKAAMQYKSIYATRTYYSTVVPVESGKIYTVSIFDPENDMSGGCVVTDKAIVQTVPMPNWDMYRWKIEGDVLQVQDTNSSGSSHHTYICEIE